MKKLFSHKVNPKLRIASCFIIIPLSSPVAVQGVLSVMPISSSVAVPLMITLLTLAYAWCIWAIRNSSANAMPDEDGTSELGIPAE